MILVTTTPSVDGYTITNYQGIVFGEVVSGVNMFKDLGAGLHNMFGGRSQGYEEELMRARNEAIAEMQQRAEAMGAHAVVGVDIDYEVLPNSSMAEAPYTAQAALTGPAGAIQMSTMDAAMHSGRVARCSHPRRRGLRLPNASTGTI